MNNNQDVTHLICSIKLGSYLTTEGATFGRAPSGAALAPREADEGAGALFRGGGGAGATKAGEVPTVPCGRGFWTDERGSGLVFDLRFFLPFFFGGTTIT